MLRQSLDRTNKEALQKECVNLQKLLEEVEEESAYVLKNSSHHLSAFTTENYRMELESIKADIAQLEQLIREH